MIRATMKTELITIRQLNPNAVAEIIKNQGGHAMYAAKLTMYLNRPVASTTVKAWLDGKAAPSADYLAALADTGGDGDIDQLYMEVNSYV